MESLRENLLCLRIHACKLQNNLKGVRTRKIKTKKRRATVYPDDSVLDAHSAREDMFRSGIQNVNGILFTAQSKEEMATIMREKTRNGEIHITYTPANKTRDIDLTAELNIEKYELMKTGHLRFSHPEGSHDDIFWSMALAVYAAAKAPLPGAGAIMLPH